MRRYNTSQDKNVPYYVCVSVTGQDAFFTAERLEELLEQATNTEVSQQDRDKAHSDFIFIGGNFKSLDCSQVYMAGTEEQMQGYMDAMSSNYGDYVKFYTKDQWKALTQKSLDISKLSGIE